MIRDLHRAVGRAGVDDDDLSFAVGDQRLHALQRASNIGFFVKSDDDDESCMKRNSSAFSADFSAISAVKSSKRRVR